MSADGDRTGGGAPSIPLIGASSGRRSSAGKKPKRKRHRGRALEGVDMYGELVRDSDLEPIVAREMLAATAVDLRGAIDMLSRKRRESGLNGEEARSLVGAVSNLRRVLEQLGAARPTKDEGEDFGGEA